MSMTITLWITTGKDSTVVFETNHTHNCQLMWTLALQYAREQLPECDPLWKQQDRQWTMCGLSGLTADAAAPILEFALKHMNNPDNEAQYAALNSSNGFGDFRSARSFMRGLVEACKKHYLTTIDVSC